MQATSSDGSKLYYETTGSGDIALLFVHGWMGNARWWDAQRDAFASTHQVAQMDLAGHGASDRTRTAWTAAAYADDIVAVATQLTANRIILVGHSMSGAYATLAASRIERLAMLILVDTMKNLDQPQAPAQVDAMLATYRADYATAVAAILPRFLFAPGTPATVRDRLSNEFLAVDGDTAAKLVEPLYRFDVREAARQVRVPVRAIDTDLHPHDVAANRRYFSDYLVTTIPGYGHYPMLEDPETFNAALAAVLPAR